MPLAANIAVIILEVMGLRISITDRSWKILAFYTQLSNLVTLASSVAFLLLGATAAPLRYLSSCMLTMTFLVTLLVLVPMGGGFEAGRDIGDWCPSGIRQCTGYRRCTGAFSVRPVSPSVRYDDRRDDRGRFSHDYRDRPESGRDYETESG